MSKTEQCGSCRYYVPANRGWQDYNECHHNPPVVGDIAYPRTLFGGWCGGYAARLVKDDRRIKAHLLATTT